MLRREPELAARLLLQRRGDERSGRPARVGLALDRADCELDRLERCGERAHRVLVELDRALGLERAVAGEVPALGDPAAVDRGEPRVERAGHERADDVPVLGGAELDPLALALDHETRRDRLDAARGEALHHLPPEDRRDLVPVEAVEDPSGLLRVHEPVVDLASLAERALDRRLRDLVEHHPPDRHLRLEDLDEMPGDRLPFAVFVCREQELVGVLELRLQVADDRFLLRVDDVERLELVVDVHAEARPRLLLLVCGNLGGVVREVADVADRRLDHVVLAEVAGDRLGLRRGLDDHQAAAARFSGLGCF